MNTRNHLKSYTLNQTEEMIKVDVLRAIYAFSPKVPFCVLHPYDLLNFRVCPEEKNMHHMYDVAALVF